MQCIPLVNLFILTAGNRWRFGVVGYDIGQINEVTLSRVRLVLEWVTVPGFNSRFGKFISV